MLLVVVTGLPGTGKSTMADHAGEVLPASVLSHDWAMSGLRPFLEVEAAVAAIRFGNRQVGWSILRALGRAELRRGRSVVLDGVARPPDIEACKSLASEEHAGLVIVEAICSQPELHRARVEGRRRMIPGWYEITWTNVLGSAETWEAVEGADLTLDAAESLEDNYRRLDDMLLR
jgi:predicted kinase